MNLSGNSSQRICTELRKIFKTRARKLNSLLREPVSILTTGNYGEKTGRRQRSRQYHYPPEWKFSLPQNCMEFLLLCCVSWYLDDDIGILLRLALEEKNTKFGPDYEQKILLLLQSEPEMIIYILESNVLGRNPNEVFGNILATEPKIRRILIYNSTRSEDSLFWKGVNIELKFINTKVKKPQFHRGYRDKGHLSTGSEYRAEVKKDFSTTEEQNQIEEHRQAVLDSIQFNLGFLQ